MVQRRLARSGAWRPSRALNAILFAPLRPMDQPVYRPLERFWPYAELPEQPTEEELALANPELRDVLFGRKAIPFSISIEFPIYDGDSYPAALEYARASDE